jgi:hypothetical protein
MVDENLLSEAVRLTGARTYSEAVARGLQELVRRIKARRILEFAGSGQWEGDLAAMRRDSRAARPRTGPRR